MTLHELRRRALPVAAAGLVLATGCATPRIEARPAAAHAAVSATPVADTRTPRITIRQVGTAYAGGVATFEEIAANFDAGGGPHEIDYGDGTATSGLGSDFACGGRRPGTGPHTSPLTHVYRYPGTWTVTVRATIQCGERALETVVGTGVIEVLPADAPSNGPYQPLSDDLPVHCDAARNAYGAPAPAARTIDCYVGYGDEDGYVTRVVLDWGDGSAPSVWEYPLAACVDSTTTWPSTVIDEDVTDDAAPARHTYAKAGTYRAQATVTSSGCDGADVQVGTASATVTVG